MNYLFSNKFKKVGWVLFGIGILLGFIHIFIVESPNFLNITVFALVDKPIGSDVQFFDFISDNILNEICAVFIIVGGILAAFSKEKDEDEFISKIRLDSLVWATYFNYAVLLISVLFIYGFTFFWVLVFNMFTTLIIFLIKFNLALIKIKKHESA